LQLWSSINTAAQDKRAPEFLFQESNVIIRAIRDYLRPDIGEVIVDNKEAYDLATTFVQQVIPNYQSKVKLYEQESTPLFNHYQIEGQIETAFEREVKLPSGGSIVIDVTEALVAIDINSSRATKGSDIEETALQTNLEAADEIARQFRLRDIGGLVVIDFIDMQPARNQRAVEQRMQQALEMDRARVQVGRISRFGLLEMSRQRLRPSLGETTSKVCPRCSGQGTIRSTRSLALSILRLLDEQAQKERSAEIRAITPVKVATFLLNEKRKAISEIEVANKTRILIVPNTDMVTPHYEVQRLRDDNEGGFETSYKILGSQQEEALLLEANEKPAPIPQPAVQPLAAMQQAPNAPMPKQEPAPTPEKAEGLFGKLLKTIKDFFAPEEEKVEEKPEPKPKHNPRRNRNNERRNNRNGSNRRNNSRDDRNQSGSNDSRRTSRNNEKNNDRNNQRNNNVDKNAKNDRKEKVVDQEVEQNNTATDRPEKRPNNRKPRNQQRRRGNRKIPEKNTVTESKAENSASTTEQQPAQEQPKVNSGNRQNNHQTKDKPKTQQKESTSDNTATTQKQAIPSQKVAAEPKATTQAPSQEPVKATMQSREMAPGIPAKAQPLEQNAIGQAQKPKSNTETVAKTTVAATTPGVTEVVTAKTESYSRPSNDPRKNPRPLDGIVINTTSLSSFTGQPLDTQQQAAINHEPRAITRPKNDPRSSKENA